MYGQTLHYPHTADHAFNAYGAGIMPAAYSVRVAGAVVDAWMDGIKHMAFPFVTMRMPNTDNPLRAALPSSVSGLFPVSQSAQPVWRASLIETGHSDFLAVLDQIGARHRTASGMGALQAAFGDTGE